MGDVNSNPQLSGLRSIALITGSIRSSRIGHLIAQHVASQLSSSLSSEGIDNIRLSSIDSSAHPLPLRRT